MGTGREAGMGWERGRGRLWRPVDEHRMGTENGDGNDKSSGDGNGDENGSGNEDRIGEGGREAKKCCKKPHKSCRRHVGKGGDLGGKRKNVEKKGLVQ